MTAWIVVPAKAPGTGKTRLATILDEAGRERLVVAMLGHVLATIGGGGPPGRRTFLLGPPREGLPIGVERIDDPGGGLDAALAFARDRASVAGVARVLLLAGDLPRLTAADVTTLLAVGADTVAIGPDRAGQGTNALSLPLPAAAGFRFGYGPGSAVRHAAEAARLGLAPRRIVTPGIATDIDVPTDLALVPPGLASP